MKRITLPRAVLGAGLAAAVLAPPLHAQTAPLPAPTGVATTVGATANEAPVRTVTLDEALRLAGEANPQVVSAAGAVTSAAAAERSAKGAYLPRLSATAGSSLQGTNVFGGSALGTPGTAESYSAGVSASYDLYTGGRRGAERDAADAATASAQAELTAQRASAGLSVRRAFYEALRTEDLLAVAQSRVERANEGVTAAEQRRQLGSATRSDALRAQLELNTARSAVLEARTARDAARLSLGRLVGADEPVGASRTDAGAVAAMTDGEAAALLASIAEASPEVRAAQAAGAAAEAQVDAARSQFRPSLTLSSGYGWRNDALGIDESQGSWSLSLGVSYPIFDGYQREEGVVRARVAETAASARLADAVRGVRSEAARALGQLRLVGERIALAEQAVETAREDLRVQRERYRLGSSTILELLTSQEALVEAETGVVTARYDYQVARAELEALAGRTL